MDLDVGEAGVMQRGDDIGSDHLSGGATRVGRGQNHVDVPSCRLDDVAHDAEVANRDHRQLRIEHGGANRASR